MIPNAAQFRRFARPAVTWRTGRDISVSTVGCWGQIEFGQVSKAFGDFSDPLLQSRPTRSMTLAYMPVV